MTGKTQSLSFYVCSIRSQKPSPSLNSIQSVYSVEKIFLQHMKKREKRWNPFEQIFFPAGKLKTVEN